VPLTSADRPQKSNRLVEQLLINLAGHLLHALVHILTVSAIIQRITLAFPESITTMAFPALHHQTHKLAKLLVTS
jgi:hypothetical protein